MGTSVMGTRIIFLAAVFFVAALAAALNAKAEERIKLHYPGWALLLDKQVVQVPGSDASSNSRTFSLRLPGAEVLPAQGAWRLPLRESMFLSLEATFSTRHFDPAHPALARSAFQAGVGVGIEF